ncbi:MAG: hypothetical protein RL701_4654 [Pseudomonadota bacterium]
MQALHSLWWSLCASQALAQALQNAAHEAASAEMCLALALP